MDNTGLKAPERTRLYCRNCEQVKTHQATVENGRAVWMCCECGDPTPELGRKLAERIDKLFDQLEDEPEPVWGDEEDEGLL